MITVDRNNTVWVTDVGRHQALQFSASGQLLREVGKKMEPGHDKDHLCKPTQVGCWMAVGWQLVQGYYVSPETDQARQRYTKHVVAAPQQLSS